MNLLRAPIDALYNREFYKRLPRESLGKGFLYLACLGLIFSVLSTGVFIFRGLPQIDRFVEWVKQDMPPLTWTPEGLVMNAASPYDMIHPEYEGLIITFDTTVDQITEDEMGDAVIFITSQRAYARQSTGQMRVYDLTQAAEDVLPDQQAIVITPELIDKTYGSFKPIAMLLVILFVFPFFYLWKLLTALFYSLIALLVNLTRTSRLEYSKLLNISMFAITASTLIQSRGMIFPFLLKIPFPFILSFLVTGVYLVYAIKFTEESADQSPPSV